MQQEILRQQENEITEHHIYRKLAALSKNAHNREVLEKIAADELRHYGIWRKITGRETGPNRLKV